jgi:lipopolysaccharide cholinephosphotransferase
MQSYNSEGTTLRRAQLKMLYILNVIVAIFEKNDIPYWLDYGSALGAARHKGFIPWDDDLDVTIPEEYYIRASIALINELPPDLILQSKENTENYPNTHLKVRDLNSIYVEKGFEYFRHKGIFVDIFPAKKTNLKIQKLINKYKYNISVTNIIFNKYLTPKYILYKSLELLFKAILPFFSKKHHIIPYFENKIIPLNLIYPLSVCKFEGVNFNCPNDLDNYLKILYGDYLKLPPIENRKTHAVEIIFND